ncbi:MAG: hypothetical protein R3C99_22705 [Pirellulaceae bacterium]|nr:hypothetical protein [Planctomycetales bacterium]
MLALNRTVWILVAMIATSGCVQTFNPVYQADDLVYDASLVGSWRQAKSMDVWELKPGVGKSYAVTFREAKGHSSEFVAHAAKVNDVTLLDLFPTTNAADASFAREFHQVPIHSIYLVKATSPNIVLAAIDHSWLEAQLNSGNSGLEFVTIKGRKIITSPTEKLQKFFSANSDRFTNELTLERTSD